MGPLFAYSLVPVLSVALLLCFTASLRARNARGLALYCLTVAAWSGTLLMLCMPRTAWLGERLVSMGTFTAAGFLHAAYNVTGQRSYRLVVFAYLVALGLTVLGAVEPGVLYGPLAMTRGPLFWPAMMLAVVAMTVPLVHLVREYRVAPARAASPDARRGHRGSAHVPGRHHERDAAVGRVRAAIRHVPGAGRAAGAGAGDWRAAGGERAAAAGAQPVVLGAGGGVVGGIPVWSVDADGREWRAIPGGVPGGSVLPAGPGGAGVRAGAARLPGVAGPAAAQGARGGERAGRGAGEAGGAGGSGGAAGGAGAVHVGGGPRGAQPAGSARGAPEAAGAQGDGSRGHRGDARADRPGEPLRGRAAALRPPEAPGAPSSRSPGHGSAGVLNSAAGAGSAGARGKLRAAGGRGASSWRRTRRSSPRCWWCSSRTRCWRCGRCRHRSCE